MTGRISETVLREWPDAIAIPPRHPVADGHVLVLSKEHVTDVADDPVVSGRVMIAAAELAAEHPACNVITSRGAAATQTVFHLHLHVVPRSPDDGLPLPWSPQQDARRAAATRAET